MQGFKAEHIKYFQQNMQTDFLKLALKKSPFEDLSMKKIVQQIQGMHIARKKFPSFSAFPNLHYPPRINLEQSSSEPLAKLKANLLSKKKFADLTGGFGVDTFWIGKKMETIYHVEPNRELQSLVAYNFKQLGLKHVKFINNTAEYFLREHTEKLDWIFLDPSRRIGTQRKIGIANYEPNIYELNDELLEVADNILIKVSPMQDLSEIVSSLNGVHKIILCEWEKELKEVLIFLNRRSIENKNIQLEIHHLESSLVFTKNFSAINLSLESKEIMPFVFEPGPALQKSGLINSFGSENGLTKINENSQLLFSASSFLNPLGKSFRVVAVESLNKKKLRPYLKNNQANVISRNFPIKAPAIKEKIGIKEGGEIYLIATTATDGKAVILIAERLDN